MTPMQWILSRDTGISSRTIFRVMIGEPAGEWYECGVPLDPDDFGRCYRLLEAFPEWKPRLREVAQRHPEWSALVAAWDELTQMYRACCGPHGEYLYPEQKKAASALYDRMTTLRDNP